jgi:ATP/maltotriose-dependent transcriptional regulator MalT
MRSLKTVAAGAAALLVATTAFATLSKDDVKKLDEAAAVLSEIRSAPDNLHCLGNMHITLSVRELEVLRLISIGLSNQAIAERLFISEHTVHRHVANTLTKLSVPSRSAAVAHAAKLGLL